MGQLADRLSDKLVALVADAHRAIEMDVYSDARAGCEVTPAVRVDEGEACVVELGHQVLGQQSLFTPAKDLSEIEALDAAKDRFGLGRLEGKAAVMIVDERWQKGVGGLERRDLFEPHDLDEPVLESAVGAFDAALGLP